MKIKIKLLLVWLLSILTVQSTYALTIKGYSYSANILSEKQGFVVVQSLNYAASCPVADYWIAEKEGITGNAICIEGPHKVYAPNNSYWFFFRDWMFKGAYGDYGKYYLPKDNSRLYVINRIPYEGGYKYINASMKMGSSTLRKITSKRGSHVFENLYVQSAGLLFATKDVDRDQPVIALNVANMYFLDWFFYDGSFLWDTYRNKIYKYNRNLMDGEFVNGNLNFFQKLRNIAPDEVFDVEWSHVNNGQQAVLPWEPFYFSFINQTKGSSALHQQLQQDLKDSLIITNEERSPAYLGVDPEELWLNKSPELKDNNSTSNASNGNQDKKQCIDYYTDMRAMTSHADRCFGDGNNTESQGYWYDVIEDADLSKYSTRDKARYWRCWLFNDFKQKKKKQYWENWDRFWKEWKSDFLGATSDQVNPQAKCSHISEFPRTIYKTWFDAGSYAWWLIQNDWNNDYKLLNDYTSMKVACSSFITWPLDFLSFGSIDKSICARYKDLSFTKYKEKIVKWLTGEDTSDWSLFISWWSKISNPFYSGYNYLSFLAPNCWWYKRAEFDIFAIIFFVSLMFYLLKFL